MEVLTIAPVEEELKPKWAKPDYTLQLYRMPRYRLFELIKDRAIRSALIRRKGSKKGMRLIDLASLDAYLERHATPNPIRK